jgi:ribosomal-protein-alanine N-acetyltransferase
MKLFRRSQTTPDLRTERLRLVAMTPEMLIAEIEQESRLGLLLRATQPAEWPPKDFEPHVVRMIRQQALESPEKRGWHRYVVSEGDAVLVGCIGAFPKPNGIAEIGYSTLPQFQRRGFATEAVRCLVEYLLQQDGVEAIRAQAFAHAEESFKVMQRAGLHPAGEGDDPGTLQYLRQR